ncbi:MAG TPA: efflux RND transporter periplasmic adaptor subunit [Steroidobacteraceae bacterium]|nr:efflux RND transporter periplasmic adaptor subunit [Steroidobacteraceae bacterium]
MSCGGHLWSRRLLPWTLSAVACLLVGGALLVHERHAAAAVGRTSALRPSLVAAIRVQRMDLYREITIPAEFRAYNEVDVHAKVSGYISELKVDIGDRVKAGQLLAVLEVPELHDELDRASAVRRRAAADYKDAHLSYTRLLDVNREHPNLIAQQDLDTAEARDATTEGALVAARADVDRYQTLVDYTRITAPFSGVVTKRYADPGTLIQAGTTSATQATPLVRISEITLLRLDFPVSVDYVHGIHVGAVVHVRVDSLGDRVITGTIARFTDRVDDSTRTMTVEMEVPNRSLELVPGMYAHVTLKVDERSHVLAIPIEAVPANGSSILVINPAGRLEARSIKLGLETPTQYEVVSGLQDGELIMLGSSDRFAAGQAVEPRVAEPLARQ